MKTMEIAKKKQMPLPADSGLSRSLWRLAAITVACMMGTAAWAQAVLEGVSYDPGSGGTVDVVLELSGVIPEPQVFTTDNPARIALDLAGTTNALTERSIAIGTGAASSVTAVEAGGRTRVVIDLFRSAPFETRQEGNSIVVSIQGGGSSAIAAQARQRPDVSDTSSVVSINNVDFRRGDNGEGRIIVDFSDPGANIDLSKQGEKILVSILNAEVPVELERRMDVLDFATPVQIIDTFRSGKVIRMNIEVSGEYEHLAYQTGNQYVIEVQEYVEPQLSLEDAILLPPTYEGSKVTFNFQDIPIRAVLQLIADVSSLNIVVSDSVSGNVTLRLQSVPWDQALDVVLQSKSLGQEQTGNVIWIAPASEIAAFKQQRLAALQEQRKLEPVRSSFIQVNYAKAADLAELVRQAASGGDDDEGGLLSKRGSVTVDERTNVLLVTDTGDRLEEIRELVNLLDRPVQQVQIESRIVVAADTFSDELGVRFGLTSAYEDSHGNLFSTSGRIDGTDALTNAGLLNRSLNPGGSALPVIVPGSVPGGVLVPALGDRLNVNMPASNSAGHFAWSVLTSDYLLDLELSALESEGRGEVISSPRLITSNQTEAFIQQGVEIPFQQASSSGATNVQFKDAVLELKVTPLITPDNRVILDLNVKKDSVGQLTPVEGGGLVPSIDTREIETQVLIDSGQTVVLGGIFEQTRRHDTTKIPVLGDIPGLGILFRQRTNQKDKAELLIFVTPTILEENFGLLN
jgi:type IV pilus assembly protein PilQ